MTRGLGQWVAWPLVAAVAFLTGAALTGRTKRAYRVLGDRERLAVAGVSADAATLARRYLPDVRLPAPVTSPPLLSIAFEVIPRAERVSIVYHYVWETEVVPHRALDPLYAVFRSAYYGYPPYDIEYFQLDVDRTDGTVVAARFETAPSDDYDAVARHHLTLLLDRMADGSFAARWVAPSGREIRRREGLAAPAGQDSLRVSIQSWNHLFRLPPDAGFDAMAPVRAPLEWLSDSAYARWKLARRSQGDVRTSEPAWSLPCTTVVLLAFAVVGMRFATSVGR